LGELTALPRPPGYILGRREGEKGGEKGRGKSGRGK